MITPDISVVMAVYNGESSVTRTVASVLSQTAVNLEFVIVNDGSTDTTQAILERFAATDARIKLIKQTNTGLTQALITGCESARGELIARQDNGDISLAGRLAAQLAVMRSNPNAVMTSSGVCFLAPDGEQLYTIEQTPKQARAGLLATNLSTIEGPPHHGSVMFSKQAYTAAGGYRPEFIVAQDLDLWTRLIELGEHIPTTGIYYHAAVERNSISSLRRAYQFATAKKVIACATARKTVGNDAHILASMHEVSTAQQSDGKSTRRSDSNYYYYLGSALLRTDSRSDTESATKYLKKAIKFNPLNFKAMLKLLMALTIKRSV